VTRVGDTHVPDAVYESVRSHFSEAELVNVTFAVVAINAWNRLAISFGRFRQLSDQDSSGVVQTGAVSSGDSLRHGAANLEGVSHAAPDRLRTDL
jgi:hypothetical protein